MVKGIHLEGLRVLGKPERFANYYYKNGADELFFQDTVASLYDRNSLQEIISRTAREIFIPLTVGGGIRTIYDIKSVLRSGADKVSINTAAIKNENFIQEAALRFGSSTIVISIEAIKHSDGTYFAYTDNGREYSGKEVVEWAKRAQELGAGELLITSVDKEGTGEGYDIDLINTIAKEVSIPVIAHGGCGSPSNALDLLQRTSVDALALSSILHYESIANYVNDEEYENEGNVSFLNSGRAYGKIKPYTIQAIKEFLIANGKQVRI